MSNTEFKAGDKVRRLKQNQVGLWNHGNQILTVKRTTTLDLYFEGMVEGWSKKRFELVTADEPTFEEQYRRAKSFIGKKVKCKTVTMTVEAVTIRDASMLNSNSNSINEYLKTHEYCIAVKSGFLAYPAAMVELAPEFTECLHEGQLIAKIYDDKVEMSGTQFSHAEIKKLAKLLP